MIVDLNNKENSHEKHTNNHNNNTQATSESTTIKQETKVDENNNSKDDDGDIGPPFDILFPYDRIYPEQYQYLKCVKRALHKKGHALIEAPPGTNQSLCLLSLLTSYQHYNESSNNTRRKIVYATNSVPETTKVVRELAVTMEYRQQHHKQNNNGTNGSKRRPKQHQILFQNAKDGFWNSNMEDSSALVDHYNQTYANQSDSLPFLAICLTGSDRDAIDEACRYKPQDVQMMSADSSSSSSAAAPLNGIFTSIPQLHSWAAKYCASENNSWTSPQELTKYAILNANVLVVTYSFLLDPMTAMVIGSALLDGPEKNESTSSEIKTDNDGDTKMKTEETTKETNEPEKSSLSSNAIIVFDHAHNIDAACMDSLSATVNLMDLEMATRALDKISSEIARFKQHQQCHPASPSENNIHKTSSGSRDNLPPPLRDEYERLVKHPIDNGMYQPILFPSDDVVNEPVPGNIRHMKHFIGCMKKIVEHFKNRLRLATEVKHQQSSSNTTGGRKSKKKKMGTGSVSPLAFLHQMMNATALDSKTLRFVHSRVLSMLRTLRLPTEPFVGLINVAYLASLLGFTNTLESSKFAIILEQSGVVIGHHRRQGGSGVTPNAMMLQVACLDPSLAIKPLFDRFDTVVLTSSTLSPLNFYVSNGLERTTMICITGMMKWRSL